MPLEPFSGGLVTARDPSVMEEGELQKCDEFTYRPQDSSLWSAAGRVKFTTAAATGPLGLAFCGFDGGDDVLLEQTLTGLNKAIAGRIGEFHLLREQAATEPLEAVYYMDRYFLLDGTNRTVLLADGSTRQHGMAPVSAPPVVEYNATGGTWAEDYAPLDKYYEYWITEVYKDGDEYVESTTTDKAFAVIQVAKPESGSPYVRVYRPAQKVNDNTTHWRLYRSGSRTDSVTQMWPAGYAITDALPWDATAYADDGKSAVTDEAFPTLWEGSHYTQDPQTDDIYASDLKSCSFATGGHGVLQTWQSMNNPQNALVDDDEYMVSYADEFSANRFSGFDLTDAEGGITAITINVYGHTLAAPRSSVRVNVSWDGGITWGYPQDINFTNPSADVKKTVTGLWGHVWSTADLTSTNFLVAIGHDGRWGVFDSAAYIDAISVEATYSGTGVPGDVFPAVNIEENSALISVGRNGQPPLATTGDIFMSSLVVNNPDYPQRLYYSTAGQPDYFNEKYYVPCDSRDKDTIVCFRSLGGVGVAGLTSKLFRVRYLPRETDSDYAPGDAVEPLSDARGCAGKRCMCRFHTEGQPLMLAGVDAYGPWMTDGYQVFTLTDDLDWEALVDVDSLSDAELINNPREYKLTLYYTPIGGTTNSKALDFHYHPRHMKGGKLKVSGPRTVYHKAAAYGVLGDGTRFLWALHNDGLVYLEETGDTDASNHTITPTVKTRELYLTGVGNEWKLDKLYIHHQTALGTELTASYEITRTNADPFIPSHTDTFHLLRRGMSRILPSLSGEGIAVQLTGTDPPSRVRLDYMKIGEPTGLGEEDSKK